MTNETYDDGTVINRFMNRALNTLKDEFYAGDGDFTIESTQQSIKECTFPVEKSYNDVSENTIFQRFKAMVMKKSQKPRKCNIALQKKSQAIVDDIEQFRMLKQKIQSSGMVTNEGIHQILPSIVHTQYKELIESKKKAKKQAKSFGNQIQNKGSKRGMGRMNLRNYIDNKPTFHQSSSIGSQQMFSLFPSEWCIERRSSNARGA